MLLRAVYFIPTVVDLLALAPGKPGRFCGRRLEIDRLREQVADVALVRTESRQPGETVEQYPQRRTGPIANARTNVGVFRS